MYLYAHDGWLLYRILADAHGHRTPSTESRGYKLTYIPTIITITRITTSLKK